MFLHRLSRSSSSSRRGFTLIELLAVIAIIGILAAILIPTVGAVRRKANSARSAGNLRQLASAILSFSSDNRSRFPAARNGGGDGLTPWDRQIVSYLGLRLIPGDPLGRMSSGAEALFFHPGATSIPVNDPKFARRTYSMPSDGTAAGGYIGNLSPSGYSVNTMAKIPTPSRVVLLVERTDANGNNLAGLNQFAETQPANVLRDMRTGDTAMPNLNGGTNNFAFADGHVRSLRLEDTVGRGSVVSPLGLWTVRDGD